MRLGLLLGFDPSLDALVSLARAGEAAGMAAMYPAEAQRSAVVGAAAVIAATERITVGTYVVNAYARDPWLTGITARDLAKLAAKALHRNDNRAAVVQSLRPEKTEGVKGRDRRSFLWPHSLICL